MIVSLACNDHAIDFDEREQMKTKAYADRKAGRITALRYFEIMTFAWYAREDARITLDEYRRNIVRAHQHNAEFVTADVLAAYPPATGKVKIAPGQSEFYQRGIPRDVHYAGQQNKAGSVGGASGFN